MTIRLVIDITTKREPAECRPNGTAGWYVIDRGTIVAYTDTEEEATRTADAFNELHAKLAR